ncbi:MAG: AMP-dependent synthetase/ligase [Candidatus Ancillula sp.]|jgi:long-chain acyl-CoA synthetase|nr:AMP-dependent synthetase/ligase [Candidatus Ancillula sp.]
MQKYKMPAGYEVADDETLSDLLDVRVKNHPDLNLIEYKTTGPENTDLLSEFGVPAASIGDFVGVTARQFQILVNKIAKGLIKLGVEKKSRVVISSHTRIEWCLMDFAIFAAGAATVPVYETSSPEQIRYILDDADVSYAFLENEGIAQNFELALTDGKRSVETRVFEKGAIAELIALGLGVSDGELQDRKNSLNKRDMASIVYTSGSTGIPKGVVLSHEACVSLPYNAAKALPTMLCAPDAKLLLFLPLAHVFARLVAWAMIACNQTILGLSPSIKELLPDLQKFKPTVMLGVPRVFEKVFNAASHKAGTGVAGKVFDRAVKSAIDWSRAIDDPNVKGALHRKISHQIYDPIVYSQIREVLGGAVKYCVSGGAPLNEEIGHFFRGVGIHILEGYGMTETVGPIAVDRPEANKIGTIGLPFPGTEVRIAEDGELLISSPSCFTSYSHNDELTKETILTEDQLPKTIKSSTEIFGPVQGGSPYWIASGDLAEIDDEGFIKITGRKKELIVTAGGKNVSPAPMEALIDVNPLVGNSVVLGDKERFVSALITLDPEGIRDWGEDNKIKGLTPEIALENSEMRPAIEAEIQRSIDKANEQVSRAESIRKFWIIPQEFSEADGTLTPSMKVRRTQIIEKYGKIIQEKIYK